MRKLVLPSLIVSIAVLLIIVVSCNSPDAKSAANFIFKSAPKQGVVAKLGDIEVTEAELVKGIESEIYDAETRVYEIKKNKLRAMLLEQLMKEDPEKKNMSNDEFLEKVISKGKMPTQEDVDKFVVEKQIPKEQITPQLLERIKQFLAEDVKQKAVEDWMGEKSKNKTLEIYFAKPNRPVFNVNLENGVSYGPVDAKVTIVEFSDFQCPHCSKAALTVKELKEKYKGKLRVVFNNYPLPFHTDAKLASEYALCANEQKGELFWKMYYSIFENQNDLSEANLKKLSTVAGVNIPKLDECLQSDRQIKNIEKSLDDGEKAGVKSTPTFFINGKLVSGALPIQQFQEIIEEELAK